MSMRNILFLLLGLALFACEDEVQTGANSTARGSDGLPIVSNQPAGQPATTPSGPVEQYTWRDFKPLFDANQRVLFGIQRPNHPRGDSVLFGGLTFQLASTFYNGAAIVREGEHQGGLINDKGQFVLPMTCHKISGISDSGLVEVALLDSNSGKVFEGVYNIQGEVIVPVEYRRADLLNRGRLIKVAKGKKFGLLSADGEELLPAEYNEINRFVNGYSIVKKGSRYGFINGEGKVVVEPKYELLRDFQQGVALAKENGMYFIMDESFKNINGELYQAYATISYQDPQTGYYADNFGIPQDTIVRETFMTADGNIAVAQGGKYGVIGAAGDIAVPFEFDRVGLKDGEWYGTN